MSKRARKPTGALAKPATAHQDTLYEIVSADLYEMRLDTSVVNRVNTEPKNSTAAHVWIADDDDPGYVFGFVRFIARQDFEETKFPAFNLRCVYLIGIRVSESIGKKAAQEIVAHAVQTTVWAKFKLVFAVVNADASVSMPLLPATPVRLDFVADESFFEG